MTSELDLAVQKALDQRKADEQAEAEAKAGDVTGSTWFWAIVAALIMPIAGTIIGIVNLVKGRTSVGWTYIGISIVGWMLSYLFLYS